MHKHEKSIIFTIRNDSFFSFLKSHYIRKLLLVEHICSVISVCALLTSGSPTVSSGTTSVCVDIFSAQRNVGPVNHSDVSSSFTVFPQDASSAGFFIHGNIIPLVWTCAVVYLLNPVGHNGVKVPSIIIYVALDHL